MGRKLIGIAVIAIMLLGVFGLTACDNTSLAEYKVTGKALIDAHVAIKTQSDYSTEKWTDILSIAAVGKRAVEDATNKDAVDTEVKKTKEAIDMVCYEIVANDIIVLHSWYFTSGMPNNAIEVKHSDEKTVFEISVDNGQLRLDGVNLVKGTSLKAGETVYWSASSEETGEWVEQAYVEIVLKIEDYIIGYAVIKINSNLESSLNHNANVLKSVLFPKKDGQYQKISEDYVKTVIKKSKAE